ncbi:MAG: L-seryl-tRNA(Sec) selenium transferase, partial [Gammaproteobacteria bacterium]|nr:L-seryl-tRNA(Sec) selenium transferase [Gammaproteobacteria bacterium]
FSGDKLLGGPQAGIIVGRADLIKKLTKYPLTRAIRPDKLCLAALNATLLHYVKDEAEQQIPIWRMISAAPEELRARAEAWAGAVGSGILLPGESAVGGGSLPGETLPTTLFALETRSPNRLLARLRAQASPIIARVQDKRVALDPRTVLPEQEEALLAGVRQVLDGI